MVTRRKDRLGHVQTFTMSATHIDALENEANKLSTDRGEKITMSFLVRGYIETLQSWRELQAEVDAS